MREQILQNLESKFFHDILFFESVESTNDEAIKKAAAGAAEGVVIIADQQTAGRGRLQRSWESPAHKNLAISFLLRPKCEPSAAPLITLAAGAACYEATLPFLPLSLQNELKIKWPNDLYLQNKKVAGILTEISAGQSGVEWLVCGIGIDLNADLNDFSPEVQKIASSLKLATGQEVNRVELTTELIKAFEKRYLEFLNQGPAALIKFCDHHSYLKGKKVSVEESGKKIHGTAIGLSPEGYLLIEDDAGKIHTIIAGDITLPLPS